MLEHIDLSSQTTSADDAMVTAFGELPYELADLLTIRPAPVSYRNRLREQLLAAARDERIYHREFSRQMLTAVLLAMVVLSSLGGLIIWRLLGTRQRHVPVRA